MPRLSYRLFVFALHLLSLNMHFPLKNPFQGFSFGNNPRHPLLFIFIFIFFLQRVTFLIMCVSFSFTFKLFFIFFLPLQFVFFFGIFKKCIRELLVFYKRLVSAENEN